jgi:hypothetical protein
MRGSKSKNYYLSKNSYKRRLEGFRREEKKKRIETYGKYKKLYER